MTTPLRWRKSSLSGSNGACVEVADTGTNVLVRNSNHPDRGTLTFTADAMAAFVDACATGHLDEA